MQLLRTNNAARAAILANCTGLVPIVAKRNSSRPNFNRMERQVKQFKRWVVKFGTMMRSLDMALPVDDYNSLAAAMQRAAAAAPHGKLQLQAFKGARVSTRMLRTLGSICSLRSLDLGISCHGEHYEEACYEALAGLTSLEHLRLHSQAAAQLLQGTSALSRLTCLVITKYSNFTGSVGFGSSTYTDDPTHDIETCLPGQLQRLTLDLDHTERRRRPLQLQHLTVLTALDIDSGGHYPSLPSSLQHLTLSHFDTDSVQPLLALQQLRTLRINHCCCTAQQLQQLGRTLQQLTAVELSYVPIEDYDLFNVAAAGWPSLPVTSLNMIVWRAELQSHTIVALQRLWGLTRLCIESEGRHWVEAPTAAALGRVLAGLTALKELKLVGLHAAAGMPGDSEVESDGEAAADSDSSEGAADSDGTGGAADSGGSGDAAGPDSSSNSEGHHDSESAADADSSDAVDSADSKHASDQPLSEDESSDYDSDSESESLGEGVRMAGLDILLGFWETLGVMGSWVMKKSLGKSLTCVRGTVGVPFVQQQAL